MARTTVEDFIEAVASVKDGKALLSKLAEIKAIEAKLASYKPIIKTLEDAQYLVTQVQIKEEALQFKVFEQEKNVKNTEQALIAKYKEKEVELKASYEKEKAAFEGVRQLKLETDKQAVFVATYLRQVQDKEESLKKYASDLEKREQVLADKANKLAALIGA